MSSHDPVVDAYVAAHDLSPYVKAWNDDVKQLAEVTDSTFLRDQLDDVSIELRGHVARIYDTRPLDVKLRAAVALLRTALSKCGPETALAVLRIYDDVFTHTHGPGWHDLDEARLVLGDRELGHDYGFDQDRDLGTADPDLWHAVDHVRDVNARKATRHHLADAHGFEDARSWPALRAVACHRAIHHLNTPGWKP